jgi:glycine betaine/choline ABC-type transport system substrate-binding protein
MGLAGMVCGEYQGSPQVKPGVLQQQPAINAQLSKLASRLADKF